MHYNISEVFRSIKDENDNFLLSTGWYQGAENEPEQTEAEVEHWTGCYGIISVPPDMTQEGEAAQVITLQDRTQSKAVAFRDSRLTGLIGQPAPGEIFLGAVGSDLQGQARLFMKEGGTVTLYSTVGNTSDGKSIMVQLNPDGGLLLAIDKTFINLSKENEISMGNGNGGAMLDADGNWTFNGESVTFATKNVKLGSSASSGSSVAIAESIATNFAAIAVSLGQAVNSSMSPVPTYTPTDVSSSSVKTGG